jgi:hypothetical protein
MNLPTDPPIPLFNGGSFRINSRYSHIPARISDLMLFDHQTRRMVQVVAGANSVFQVIQSPDGGSVIIRKSSSTGKVELIDPETRTGTELPLTYYRADELPAIVRDTPTHGRLLAFIHPETGELTAVSLTTNTILLSGGRIVNPPNRLMPPRILDLWERSDGVVLATIGNPDTESRQVQIYGPIP